MPPTDPSAGNAKTLEQIVDEAAVYSEDAYRFVQEGLSFSVERFHGERDPEKGRHITGQQLCQGLRDYALGRWGLLAGAVLQRWGVTSTMDFGRIVYILIDNGMLQKTKDDSIEDFRNVYDFSTAFELKYRIPSQT